MILVLRMQGITTTLIKEMKMMVTKMKMMMVLVKMGMSLWLLRPQKD